MINVLKTIVFNFRPPQNATERSIDGETKGDNKFGCTWIDSRLSKTDLTNTFFHEVAHNYCNFTGQVMRPEEEARFAWFMGNVAQCYLDSIADAQQNFCFDKEDLVQWRKLHRK